MSVRGKVVLVYAAIVLLSVLTLLSSNTEVLAQTGTAFSTTDEFRIPTQNATVRFAVNGTYSTATLRDGIWNFANLQLDNSQMVKNFTFSATDSNVTILSYRITNATLWSARLRYVAEGNGAHMVNFDLRNSQLEWSVIVNTVFWGEGEGWHIAPDATLTIIGASGNVSVACYDFQGALGGSGEDTNLPLYVRHSTAIVTGVALATMVTLAVAISLKSRMAREAGKSKISKASRAMREEKA